MVEVCRALKGVYTDEELVVFYEVLQIHTFTNV